MGESTGCAFAEALILGFIKSRAPVLLKSATHLENGGFLKRGLVLPAPWAGRKHVIVDCCLEFTSSHPVLARIIHTGAGLEAAVNVIQTGTRNPCVFFVVVDVLADNALLRILCPSVTSHRAAMQGGLEMRALMCPSPASLLPLL